MNCIAHGVTKSHTRLSNFHFTLLQGFPGGASGKEPTCNAGDVRNTDLIPEWGKPPGGGHGNPLQYSCLENPTEQRSLVGCTFLQY